MNLTGRVLRFYIPGFVRRRALRELFQSTAAAFGAPVPVLPGASADELLERYAAFTAKHAAEVMQTGDVAATRGRLYDSARAIGQRLRCQLGIRSPGDALEAARAVYRMLRIEFIPTADGAVRVPRCFFSGFYSAPTCRLMSALDQGLLAGLSGGGRLEFRRRITEGAPACVAAFLEVRS